MTAEFFHQYQNKKVVFITTKNLSYIRNNQEIEQLTQACKELLILGSDQKSYFLRVLYVWCRVLFSSFRRYDIIFIGFAPQLVYPLFFWKLPFQKVHIDFFISLYDTFVNDRKKCAPNGAAAKLLKYLDLRTITGASHIVCDTKAHAEYFSAEFGAKMEIESVLYLCANRKIYYPRSYIRAQNFSDRYIVLYFGSILPLQGVEIILECIRLLQNNKNIYFQIIGPIKGNATEGMDNAHFIPWLEENQLAEYIAGADLCLAGHFNADIEKARRTIPGKAYIYEAMAKPMILGENPANRELFTEDQMHFFVEMGDAAALAQKITKCYEENR